MSAWNWDTFFSHLSSPAMLWGAWTTIWLTFVTLFFALILGGLAASLVQIKSRVILTAYNGYTALFRATPLLVQLVFLYSALPQLGINLTVIQAAILGLSIAESPYMAEIIRANILGVGRGQWEAATMLGMKRGQILRYIILPQAARTAVPPIGNEFVRQLKNTSLVSVISMTELFRITNDLIQSSFRVLEALTVATIYYLTITIVWTVFQKWLERRLSVSVLAGPSKSSARLI